MMKTRLAILAFALLPLAAGAQVPQTIPSRISPGGPPVAGPAITVMGHGTVKFAVKTLGFVAYVRAPADEAGALAAMRAAGIDDPVIGPAGSQVSLTGNGATAVRGTIRDVSVAKLERIGLAAASYVRAHPGASVDNVNFVPRFDDCAAQEQAARAAAFADARRKAQAVAELAGVTIEGVQYVSENGGCPVQNEPSFGPSAPFDLSTLSSWVTVYENVTFSVVQGTPSTRRRTL